MSEASVPATALATWDRSDLIGRVLNALDLAHQTVQLYVSGARGSAAPTTQADAVNGLLRDKIVSETAMLLLCVEPIEDLDARLGERTDCLARLLLPHARSDEIRAAVCLDPGYVRDHAVAHAILSRLGFPDPGFDALLAASLAAGGELGPERLPHRKLEQRWLSRVWRPMTAPRGRESSAIADSLLGRPMDVLGASRLDVYAFTHAVMYASDLGARTVSGRARSAVAADADACLALSLETNDFDLTAEVLLTWAMLGLAWSPAAAFAFAILTRIEDRHGFLPGITFDAATHAGATGSERRHLALSTSYHTIYVMGFLCASALRPERTPPASVPFARSRTGAGAAFRRLMPAAGSSVWREAFDALDPRRQDALAPLLLTMLLRHARARPDLQTIHDVLQVALAYELTAVPATAHAAALLRRCQSLSIR
jgi:hypothetical protein